MTATNLNTELVGNKKDKIIEANKIFETQSKLIPR
jgi:hypothetical protein